MFHSRKVDHRINSIYERALRVTYQDYKSTFLHVWQKDNPVTIHQRNLHILATEIFKAENDLSPEIMSAPIAYPQKETTLYVERFKLPITVSGQIFNT